MRLPFRVLHGLLDAQANFEQLQAVLPNVIGTGTAALSWSGTSTDATGTFNHGLSRTPVVVVAPDYTIPGTRSWQCFTGSYTATTFALLARPDGVYTGTVNFPWVAIG